MNNEQSSAELQDLRKFTVHIRNLNDETVGTGFIVSSDGKIITCAHVICTALGVEPHNALDRQVKVYFPSYSRGVAETKQAKVVLCLPQNNDDVALLQLVGDSISLSPDQIAVLGNAEASVDHSFRSYGFRPLPPYNGGLAIGHILGPVDSPPGKQLLVDPIQLSSENIAPGMSGAPVLDRERNLVVGVVSETNIPDSRTTKDRDTAWAVNAQLLRFDPFKLSIRDDPLPLGIVPQLDINTLLTTTVSPSPGIQLNGAPRPLVEWVGRNHLLQALTRDWADLQYRVTAIVGIVGQGKSSLARQWLSSLEKNAAPSRPDGIFWWNFNEAPSADTFFRALLDFLWDGQIPGQISEEEQMKAPERIIGAVLGTRRYLFILDGLESLQQQDGDQFGLVQDERLRRLLRYMAAPIHKSFCLITSRIPVLDLIEYATYTQRELGPLNFDEGRALLRRIGVSGSDAQLDKVIEDQDGYAFMLSRSGKLLVKEYHGDITYINQFDMKKDMFNEFYNNLLTDVEHTFLMLFSAFRLPVCSDTLTKVFRTKINILATAIAVLGEEDFNRLIQHLVGLMILTENEQQGCYTSHDLFRSHYAERLRTLSTGDLQDVYRGIAGYYGSKANHHAGKIPSLSDMATERTQHLDMEQILNAMGQGALKGLVNSRNPLGAVFGAGMGLIGSITGTFTFDSDARKSVIDLPAQIQERQLHKREEKFYRQEEQHYRQLANKYKSET